jgi:hypothetical protein
MFKIGDKVRILNRDLRCSAHSIGDIGTIVRIDDSDMPYEIYIPGSSKTHWSSAKGIELVTSKGKRGRPSTKPRPVKFLLKYDLDEDPIEEFETMEQVTDRIDYLVKNESSLKRDSMIVYEIKSKKVVSVETKIKMK